MRYRTLGSFDYIIMITIIGIASTVLFITSSGSEEIIQRKKRLTPQQKRDIRGAEIASLAHNNYLSDKETCKMKGLDTILVPRVSGTAENRAVRDYLASRLTDLQWDVTFDTFKQDTIIGEVEFSNVIGNSNPSAKSYVVITAHYDSKLYPPTNDGKEFLGATDSAVPCAMILSMMENLNKQLMTRQRRDPDRGIIVVFFDGEEAFKEWTATDSIYGSTHLAEKWRAEGFFDHMELFVLLDLIGSEAPEFSPSFSSTTHHFQRLNELEKELADVGLLESREKFYFTKKVNMWGIEDDHKPFKNRGYKNIVHVISVPFPPEWHKITDDKEHLHCPSIHNVQSVLQLWISDLFNLHKLINM